MDYQTANKREKEERDQEIVEYYKENPETTMTDLGEEFDLSSGQVSNILDNLGVREKGSKKLSGCVNEIAEKYKEGAQIKELAEEYGVSETTINSRLTEQGVEIENRRPQNSKMSIDDEVMDLIEEKYKNGLNLKELWDEFDVSPPVIRRELCNRGVKIRKGQYRLDEDSFESLNSNTAYWIGFVMGDGCIYKDELKVKLQEGDKTHLEKLKQFLKAEHNVYDETTSNQKVFSVKSEKIVNDLEKYGVVPRKGKEGTKVNSNLENNRHFWRGMVDADGYIANPDKCERAVISLFGCEDLVLGFKEYCEQLVDSNASLCYNDTCYTYSENGNRAVYVMERLYKKAPVYLSRKHELAECWIEE